MSTTDCPHGRPDEDVDACLTFDERQLLKDVVGL